jgi:hypothetical protein
VATTEIYVQAKKERIWVSKLREMPEGVFELLIKRIAQGDSLRDVAKYCQTVTGSPFLRLSPALLFGIIFRCVRSEWMLPNSRWFVSLSTIQIFCLS